MNLGEAAAAIVLGSGESGWELVDGAVRNDANHISGPSRTGEGSYKALRYVLKHTSPEELAFVNVHGTSTLYNDEMEAIAIDRAVKLLSGFGGVNGALLFRKGGEKC